MTKQQGSIEGGGQQNTSQPGAAPAEGKAVKPQSPSDLDSPIPRAAVCVCGHAAYDHWHSASNHDRNKKRIRAAYECSKCNKCTAFTLLRPSE